ncbi:MAG: LuxR C-terminal-related transcriptional regulator [Panacagrimonas sp.]
MHHRVQLDCGRINNEQIADTLQISESTVKIHVSSILRKLETGTRTQAAIPAQRLLAVPEIAEPDSEA